MAYKNILKDDINENLKELEYVIDEGITVKGLFSALVARYCHPIRRFDQFNNLLGAGYDERYWKVKGLERAARKKAGESLTLIPTDKPFEEDTLEGKKYIDLVDDYVIRNSKDCNTPCENKIRDIIMSHAMYFYMDVITGVYASIKEECEEKNVDFKRDALDFTAYIFDEELCKDVEITDEIKEDIVNLINVLKNGRSQFINNYILEDAAMLVFDRHALDVDECKNDNEVIELLKKSYVVLSDLIHASDSTYTAMVELLYFGLHKITDGNKDEMLKLLEEDIQSVSNEINMTEKDGILYLEEKAFKGVNEIKETPFICCVKEVLQTI